jgi:hypothetical protein
LYNYDFFMLHFGDKIIVWQCVYVDYKCNVGGLTQFENTYIQILLYIANLIGQETWKNKC